MHLTFSEVLRISKGQIVNPISLPEDFFITKIATLSHAKPSELCFLVSKAFVPLLKEAHPGILITSSEMLDILERLKLWKTTAVVVTENPYMAMAHLSEQFALNMHRVMDFDPISMKNEVTWIHPTAVVAEDAVLGLGVTIGPMAVVSSGVHIGDYSFIGAGSYVGANSMIGESTLLFPRVVLYPYTRVGSRVRLHSGVVLGADGFGYVAVHEEKKVTGHQKIYHTGHVVIEDDVEIGANTCVDRGTFGETRIEQFVKIDNLVQIGHNVHIKKGAIICGAVGMAGSSTLGAFAVLGGGSGISDHVTVGDYAKVGAYSLVSKDVPTGGCVMGNPQREYTQHFRVHAHLNQLVKKEKSK